MKFKFKHGSKFFLLEIEPYNALWITFNKSTSLIAARLTGKGVEALEQVLRR